MAGRKFAINTGSVPVSASSTVHLIGVKAPSTHGIILSAIEVSFEGSATATNERAVRVDYCTCTTDGTGTSITVNNADRQDSGSASTIAKQAYTTPPSGSVIVIRTSYIDANKTKDLFPGSLRIKQDEVFFIRLVAPSSLVTVNASSFIGGDE